MHYFEKKKKELKYVVCLNVLKQARGMDNGDKSKSHSD